jgi:photosystem II stability/assembly factor-like uncharacterized protein
LSLSSLTRGAALAALVLGAVACQVSRDPPPSPASERPSNTLSPSQSPLAVVWPAIDPRSFDLPISPWFIDPLHGFGLGMGCADKLVDGGYPCTTKVLASSDGGQTWHYAGATFHSKQNGEIQDRIRFADPLNGWIYGDGAYVTHDGGRTWRKEAVHRFVLSLTTAGGAAWATMSDCPSCKFNLYVSAANGNMWTRTGRPSGALDVLRDPVAPLSGSTAFIVGGYPYPGGFNLYRTTDAGRTWRRLGNCDGAKGADSADVAVLDIDHLWLVCGQQPSMTDQVNHLYRTSDGGSHWELVAANPYPHSADLAMGNMPDTGYLPSFTATSAWSVYITPQKMASIAFSHDGGTTWATQLGDDGGGGYSLQFVNGYDGWALSPAGLYRTTDGGAHWRVLACRSWAECARAVTPTV